MLRGEDVSGVLVKYEIIWGNLVYVFTDNTLNCISEAFVAHISYFQWFQILKIGE